MDGALEPDMINGHVYVEMGDDLKWATCNVGADKPEEVGTLFAWGETTPKATYSLDNYKWNKDGNYTKYNSTDSKQILSKEDDAATANRGGTWRTPTSNDIFKLLDYCKCTWDDARNGYVLTSESPGYEGNSLFFPSPDYNPTIYKGLYWTSFVNVNRHVEKAGVFSMIKSNGMVGLSSAPRHLGLPIRPVSF